MLRGFRVGSLFTFVLNFYYDMIVLYVFIYSFASPFVGEVGGGGWGFRGWGGGGGDSSWMRKVSGLWGLGVQI